MDGMDAVRESVGAVTWGAFVRCTSRVTVDGKYDMSTPWVDRDGRLCVASQTIVVRTLEPVRGVSDGVVERRPPIDEQLFGRGEMERLPRAELPELVGRVDCDVCGGVGLIGMLLERRCPRCMGSGLYRVTGGYRGIECGIGLIGPPVLQRVRALGVVWVACKEVEAMGRLVCHFGFRTDDVEGVAVGVAHGEVDHAA